MQFVQSQHTNAPPPGTGTSATLINPPSHHATFSDIGTDSSQLRIAVDEEWTFFAPKGKKSKITARKKNKGHCRMAFGSGTQRDGVAPTGGGGMPGLSTFPVASFGDTKVKEKTTPSKGKFLSRARFFASRRRRNTYVCGCVCYGGHHYLTPFWAEGKCGERV